MAITVKKKIRLGTLFLFLMVLLSCGLGIFHLTRLKNDSDQVLRNNYESLDYCHKLQRLLDSNALEHGYNAGAFDSVLRLQEKNITEPGEKDATARIRNAFELYRNGNLKASLGLRAAIHQVLLLNMNAIETKKQKASETANKALAYITILAAVVFIIGLTFSVNFPSVLTGPISVLTEGIQEISRKNYGHRIHLDRKDEFGQMADSFNDMAERLEYFENSNLNKIIFEKTRAEAVINSLKEASIGIDKNNIILFANGEALQLLHLPSKEIIGKSVEEISNRNDLFRFLLEEKGSLPFKVVLDNRENYFTKETMDIAQDGTSSKVIVLRNITSFKELDVAKTNLISTISHELKTPLASSDFSLKLLEDERVGELSNEQRELILNLRQDNQRMLRILSELLDMAQVEAGKIRLHVSDVNPEKIMDNALNSVSNAVKEKHIRIEKEYQKNLPIVKADTEKTTWVLNNFFTNAIKYSGDGNEIHAIIRKLDNEIEFAVSDRGPGIPAEHLQKVFERFYQVPGSKAGGTGLGLAISKEFIEAQGGEIWAKSDIGAGSTFGFTLPLS